MKLPNKNHKPIINHINYKIINIYEKKDLTIKSNLHSIHNHKALGLTIVIHISQTNRIASV